MIDKLLDVDNQSGIVETFHKDEMTGKFAVKRTQDVEGILNANQAEQTAIGNNGWQGDMHKVASIPLIIWEQWQQELKKAGAHHHDPAHNSNRKFLIAKLNDYNYSKLRTKSGRV